MAVASRLAVARVSPDSAAGRRGRPRFAVVGIPAAAQRGRRRGGAVAASPPTEEAVQMTEPLTKEDLVAYLVSGCKPKENWRIGTEHEKFGFEVETLRPIKYDQIRDILNGLSERFQWEKIIEENNVIGLKQANLPKEISDYLNKMSARVPKIKPGRATIDYLAKVQTSTRFWGGLLLSLLATSSLLLDRYLRQINEGFSIGFTSVLIIVGSIIELRRSYQAYNVMPALSKVLRRYGV